MRVTTVFEIVIIMNPFLHMSKLSLNLLNSLTKITEVTCELAGVQV